MHTYVSFASLRHESSLQLEFVVVDEVDGSRMTLGEKEEATGARVAAGSQDV